MATPTPCFGAYSPPVADSLTAHRTGPEEGDVVPMGRCSTCDRTVMVIAHDPRGLNVNGPVVHFHFPPRDTTPSGVPKPAGAFRVTDRVKAGGGV